MSTLVVYSGTTDGHIYCIDGVADDGEGGGSNGTYAEARAGTGVPFGAEDTYTYLHVGQNKVVAVFTEYQVFETFLAFDTSSVGSGSTVSAAVLNLTSYNNFTTTDFIIEARLYDWGTGLTTADWVAGANLSALTLLAHRDTASGWTANIAYDLTNDAFAANVNKTGSTRLLLCSDHTTANTAPTTFEWLDAYAADQAGTTQDPKLTVTYTAGGGGGSGALEIASLHAAMDGAPESGGASDSMSGRGFGSGDAGTASDVAALTAAYLSSEDGVATDGNAVVGEGAVPVSASDSGVATDASTALTATLSSVEAGTGADASVSIGLVGTAEQGTGVDGAGIITVPVVGVDSGTATDVSVGIGLTGTAEQGAATEVSVNFEADTPIVTESGTGSDTRTGLVLTGTAEAGTATDEVAARGIATTEDGVATDGNATVSQGSTPSVVDSGTATDAVVAVTAGYATTESGTATDGNAAVTVPVIASDSGTATETATVTALYATSDSGVGTELAALTAGYVATDSGTGTDASVSVAQTKAASDSGTASDTLTALAAVLVAVEAGAAADDVAGRNLYAVESAVGSDTKQAVEIGAAVTVFMSAQSGGTLVPAPTMEQKTPRTGST